jgi:elongation factor G
MSAPYETGLLYIPIRPKTPDDEQRLARALEQLTAEDPTIRVQVDHQSRESILGGTGELHLEVILDRLKREFNVEATLGVPQVAYREALTRPAEGEMKYFRHTGGRGQYAHVKLRLLGAPRGQDYVFVNCITGGSIPLAFIESVEAGVREALARGIVAGYPTGGVQVELYDGSYHDVDSSDAAFKIAGFLAARDAVQKAAPILLEPVMLLEVTVPDEHVEDVMVDIIGRRGAIDSRQDLDGTCVVLARAPLAELFGYATDLRERTSGRGAFKTRFYGYRPRRAAGGDGDGRESMVGAPLKPKPNPRVSGVALPEPDDGRDDAEDSGLLSI